MDITEHVDLHTHAKKRSFAPSAFPIALSHQEYVRPLLGVLNTEHMRSNLDTLSVFHSRNYKVPSGKEASAWLSSQVQDMINAGGATNVSVRAFYHANWTQDSIIATIPGRTNNTVIVGAYLESINILTRFTGAQQAQMTMGVEAWKISRHAESYFSTPGPLTGKRRTRFNSTGTLPKKLVY